METTTELKDKITESIAAILPEIAGVLLKILIVIIVLFIGWLVTKLVVKIVTKALKLAKIDKLNDMINDIEIVEGKKLNINIIKVISKFVKWIMYIMLLIIVADILNLTMITAQISDLLGYLPKLFTALVIFTIGLLLANLIKKGLKSFFDSMDLSGGKIISQIVFFIILVFITITALNVAGIDTAIITGNITMILAAFLLAFALAFGFGAQKVVGEVLKTFYARKLYEIGQTISFNDVIGEVEAINSISVTLKTKDGKLIVPIKDIVENQVRVEE